LPEGFQLGVSLVPFPADDLVRIGDPGRFPVGLGDSCPLGVVRLEHRLQSRLGLAGRRSEVPHDPRLGLGEQPVSEGRGPGI
jgi:hypothetical protein